MKKRTLASCGDVAATSFESFASLTVTYSSVLTVNNEEWSLDADSGTSIVAHRSQRVRGGLLSIVVFRVPPKKAFAVFLYTDEKRECGDARQYSGLYTAN